MTVQFFSNQLGGVVVDEMCHCAHLKSEHGSRTLSLGNDQMLRQGHEGSCCAGICACSGFQWARFVTKEEAAQVYKQKRNLVAS